MEGFISRSTMPKQYIKKACATSQPFCFDRASVGRFHPGETASCGKRDPTAVLTMDQQKCNPCHSPREILQNKLSPILEETLPRHVRSYHLSEPLGAPTLRCLSCHVQVATNTAICIKLYQTALPFVVSLKSLKSDSRSRWYCCSLRISSSF